MVYSSLMHKIHVVMQIKELNFDLILNIEHKSLGKDLILRTEPKTSADTKNRT